MSTSDGKSSQEESEVATSRAARGGGGRLRDDDDDDSPARMSVTLTYAQSLDGKIALLPRRSMRLSCDETMRETHILRSKHEAIAIGVGTVLADDPSLTTRLVPGPHPRPVIFDTHLRTPVTSKIFTARGPMLSVEEYPIIFCGAGEKSDGRAERLKANVKVVIHACKTLDDGRLDLRDCMKTLREKFGVRSLMIEGGASIITSALTAHPPFVTAVAITISPQFVGDEGVPVISGDAFEAETSAWGEGDVVVVDEEARTTKKKKKNTPFVPLARIKIASSRVIGGDLFITGELR